jgi:serine carboxypeptidase-like clade II
MGFPVKAGWAPWALDNEVAGYVTEFDAPVRFTFATVKRAGHEVPMYQPLRALAMASRWIAGQPL